MTGGARQRRPRIIREAPKGVAEIRQVRALRAEAAESVRGGWPEWERLVAEGVGTFFLVLVAAGAVVVDAVSGGRVGPAAQAIAPGLMVLALIYTLGETSGAHLNPAVSVAFAVRGDFPWRRVPGYVLAQIAGALAAASLLRGLFGTAGHLGATAPGRGVGSGAALVLEMVLTLGLATVILGTASGARNIGHNAAIAVGGYVALAGLWAGPAGGGSMNPARSLGPALVGGTLAPLWIYLVGPLVGAVLAVPLAWILRGPPSAAAAIAAQGRRGRPGADGPDDSGTGDSPPAK
ncbi:aquaporin [Kitasatospora sp. MAP5-34]|uniref:MIP/aquaporin family protein n=1 Tax=Kitasatospora sp. MAP5-34 TaxID=3035102 RepID=UPI002475FD8C|nr:aquaporin [Kitasatospora sp. MAP5-34]MDH6574696.1 aquaporin Z [Kitasatospora sp. MAP5-34]